MTNSENNLEIHNQKSFKDQDIDRMYKVGDNFFLQGVELGMKSFDHLITISSAVLGLLLTIKSKLIFEPIHLSLSGEQIFDISVLLFIVTIIFSILRNYYSGYVLVYRGERFIQLSNYLSNRNNDESKYRHLIAKDREKNSECKRKAMSLIARFCFLLAITALGILIILSNTPTTSPDDAVRNSSDAQSSSLVDRSL